MTDRMPRIGVAGVHGHGATHVRAARELEREGRVVLLVVADHRPSALDGTGKAHGAPCSTPGAKSAIMSVSSASHAGA
jgi:predicted dehydrogenase